MSALLQDLGLDLDRLQAVLAEGPPPLFATVSGAHLYGFASPDSDVDLRGAFVAPLREVLSLREPPETITVSRTEPDGLDLDWVAHDVHKFARLMTKRNGYVLEQVTSPLVVYGGAWLDELRALADGCRVRPLYFHYRGFFANQRKELGRRPTVKALLYAYRVALTGIHVLRGGEVLADLPALLEALAESVDGLRAGDVRDLVARKREGDEQGTLRDHELDAHTAPLDALEAALTAAHEKSSLPRAYAQETLDGLSDFVVRARLALGQ